jgi:predicted membrane chloride channel (bestrophin family)
MIQYQKGIFNINLLYRLHGSAIYRAALVPGILSVVIYLLIVYLYPDENLIDDPTPVSLLVGSVAFLIIFRVNNSYDRYWEACGNVFAMTTRWVDAAAHTACYHLQSEQYNSIKPPSYFDHPQLNACFMTREREHVGERSKERKKDRTITRSIEYVEDAKKQETSRNYNRNRKASVYFSSTNNDPIPLFGEPALDGGWGLLYPPTDTFFNPREPLEAPRQAGFASTVGGRTAALFLQEIAHLASLLNAVALSTLRNDIDGAESPLDVYQPGQTWPKVDLTDFSSWKLNGLKYLTGADRTPEARTEYNRLNPILVLGGVSDSEIHFLQLAKGPMAKTQLAWNWMSEFIAREHLSGSQGAVGSPIISQTMKLMGNGMANYAQARKIMFVPFPYPSAQISAFFVWVIVAAIPLVLEHYTFAIWLGALMTFFSVTCLVGLHEVARELENPFRNVPNDIPVCTLQAQMNESLITIFSGYHPDAYWDPSQEINRDVSKMDGKANGDPEGPRNAEMAESARLDVIEQQAIELRAAQAEIERLKTLLRQRDDMPTDWKNGNIAK